MADVGRVAEPADAVVSKTAGETHGGSTPLAPTTLTKPLPGALPTERVTAERLKQWDDWAKGPARGSKAAGIVRSLVADSLAQRRSVSSLTDSYTAISNEILALRMHVAEVLRPLVESGEPLDQLVLELLQRIEGNVR